MMKRYEKLRFSFAAALAATVVCIAGCTPLLDGGSTNRIGTLPEPDEAFMKRVENDPFPQATVAGALRR